jgi:hypothetical protein
MACRVEDMWYAEERLAGLVTYRLLIPFNDVYRVLNESRTYILLGLL